MAFGVREFELALMHRMRDLNADRVERALRDMDATRADLREAHTRWTRMAYATKGAAALRMALGAPPDRESRPVGSLTCDVLRWPLPSWPGLAYEAMIGPGGELWNQWFVRPGPPARLALGDLVPWTCVVADLGASFPGATQLEGPAPQHWTVDFPSGGRTYRARFVYGLFQRLDHAPSGVMEEA